MDNQVQQMTQPKTQKMTVRQLQTQIRDPGQLNRNLYGEKNE